MGEYGEQEAESGDTETRRYGDAGRVKSETGSGEWGARSEKK
jgi:hypothetical protein